MRTTSWRTTAQSRPLGHRDLSVSEIGYGAWGHRRGRPAGATEDESARALHRAAMRTVGTVERNTAVGDGRPLSPERIALLARHRRERAGPCR
ncbi:hypothetical protein [Streptomyces sp. NPDC001568]|uniref:hypothetical protein n=1 Tax=Streptomyces sp. NPDC001568 TaxID=3364588 RepID=UPI00369233F7